MEANAGQAAAQAIGTLAVIDWVIVLTYIVGMQLVGLFYARYVHSAGDLFLAGRTLPFWAIGISIVASDIGAIDLITGSGAAYRFGIAQANFDWLGSVPALLLAAFVFVPYYWRAGVFTIPEFLGRRYHAPVQWIHACIWLVFMATNVSIMLWTSATVLHTILGWEYQVAIPVTAVLVGIYTITGGLAAVVMTDVMQVVVMFVGAGALVFLSLWEAGGIAGMSEKILAQGPETQNFFHLMVPPSADTPYPWPGIVFGLGLILSTGYFVGNQAVLQRALGARSEWDAKAGLIIAGGLKVMIPLLMFVPGLCARAIYPGLENPDSAVPQLVRDLMPAGLIGLMFAAFFAALMSSIDSYLNSCVTLFVSDIYSKAYRRVRHREMSDDHAVFLGRCLTGGVLIGAGILAPTISQFETIYIALQTMLSIVNPPTLAILLLGLAWRRATRWGGLAGLLIGLATSISLSLLGNAVFESENPFLYVSIWSFLVAAIATIVVSLLTPPEPAEKLRGLILGDVPLDAASQQALQARWNQT
jgi:SSS family solute:Na+ symporter